MISQYKLRSLYYALALLVNMFVTGYMLINDDNMNDVGTQRVFLVRSIFCVVWVICAFWYIKDIYIIPYATRENGFRLSLLRWLITFCICTCIAITITHAGSIKELISTCTIFVCPCFALMGSYDYARLYGEKQETVWFLIATMLVCVFAYFKIYNLYNVLGEQGHFAVAYYPLYFLPVVLVCDKKWVRYAIIAIVSIVIFTSIKRGGLLALFMGVSAFIVIHQYIKQEKSLFIFRTVTILIVVFILGYIGIVHFGDALLDRVMNTDDTTGSGRTEIWKSLYTNLRHQSIYKWVVGNGHLTTMRDSYRNLSAHNDFLEIAYNYGGINIFLYLGFFFSLIAYTLRAIKQRSKYAPHLAMSVTIYFILSMLSIIILSHTFTLSLINTALLIGWNEYESHNQETIDSPTTTTI